MSLPDSPRKQAALLLQAVVDEQLSPQVAINRWPVSEISSPDPSLECAFWALWHFEADEVQQQTEEYYMDTQLELLKQMAQFLGEGQALPSYMLAHYRQSVPVRFYWDKTLWNAYRVRVQERWNYFRRLIKQILKFGCTSL